MVFESEAFGREQNREDEALMNALIRRDMRELISPTT